MSEMTRLVYDSVETRNPAAAAFLQSLAPTNKKDKRERPPPAASADGELVPVPLSADVWSSAVFHRKVAREELVGAIVGNRTAALLCHGLAALDDETLQYFSDHPSMLTRIADRSAPAFAAFSNSLHIRGSRVVPPGRRTGQPDEITPLWEAVVGEKAVRPDHFVTQLFEANEGRLAYLFDTIGRLDAPRRAFALGLWLPNAAQRVDRFKLLATTGISSYRDWHMRTQPFGRSSYDLAMTLMRVNVDDRGVPVGPASRGFWQRVFAATDLPDDAARQLRGIDEEPFDAAWLTETIGAADVRPRIDRLDQIAFAQRMFGGSDADRSDVFVAARALARYRMLVLTLERIGVKSPAVVASTARQAVRLGSVDGHRGFVALAQFQGALALVARMVTVHTIDVATAQKLIERLAALPLSDENRYMGAVAHWLRDTVVPVVPPAKSLEATIVGALSGPPSADGAPTRLIWEGQRYRLDLGAAERRRLEAVRDKQEGLPLDTALTIAAIGRDLAVDTIAVDGMQSALERLNALSSGVPERGRPEDEDSLVPNMAPAPETRATLRKAAEDLLRAARNKETKRASRISAPLLVLADELLAQTLLSFAYAADLGDPEGAILLVDDVSRRHDFGLGMKDGDLRARAAWTTPRQDVSPGAPWHVTGSLLGLDVALAQLGLRRVGFERVLEAPKLTSNQRDVFAISVALMNPFVLRDEQRDGIVDGIETGRRRVAAAATAEEVTAIFDDLGLEGARRRALLWTFARERDRVESLFSLTELLLLGRGRLRDLDAWGMSMLATTGCVCSRLTAPGEWSTLSGRPQLGVVAAGMADVNLQVAIRLTELQLPAPLARVVLSAAMQDFIDQVRPSDDGDWITMTRMARKMSREQVEDYIAAATAAGPLVPDDDRPKN